ncbi:hypothetical protein K440DRAFT_640798 [Wilcoxina mikolae CBS 423.85]|nr:hypothetical protein K440DRAFT_640798 [Wilcoxina mikolae CBS 423.85]
MAVSTCNSMRTISPFSNSPPQSASQTFAPMVKEPTSNSLPHLQQYMVHGPVPPKQMKYLPVMQPLISDDVVLASMNRPSPLSLDQPTTERTADSRNLQHRSVPYTSDGSATPSDTETWFITRELLDSLPGGYAGVLCTVVLKGGTELYRIEVTADTADYWRRGKVDNVEPKRKAPENYLAFDDGERNVRNTHEHTDDACGSYPSPDKSPCSLVPNVAMNGHAADSPPISDVGGGRSRYPTPVKIGWGAIRRFEAKDPLLKRPLDFDVMCGHPSGSHKSPIETQSRSIAANEKASKIPAGVTVHASRYPAPDRTQSRPIPIEADETEPRLIPLHKVRTEMINTLHTQIGRVTGRKSNHIYNFSKLSDDEQHTVIAKVTAEFPYLDEKTAKELLSRAIETYL